MSGPTFIFDFDGTICDSSQIFTEVFTQIAAREKLTLPNMSHAALRDLGAREFIAQTRINPWRIPFVVYRARKLFVGRIAETAPFPGIIDELRALKQSGVTLGIVTSNEQRSLTRFFAPDLLAQFSFLMTKTSLFGKSRALKKAVNKHGLHKHATVYVGDEVRDVEAARDAGILSAAVTWGFNSESALAKATPTFWVHKPADLSTLNQALRSRSR